MKNSKRRKKKGNKGGKSEENAFELTRVHYSVFAVLAPSHLLRSYRLDVANSRT